MKATGVYLRKLRERKYSSRDTIAAALKVDRSQIERIEKGQHNVGSPFMFQFIDEVEADLEHVAELMRSTDELADIAAAESLAVDRLKVLKNGVVNPYRGEQYEEVDSLIGRLIDHSRAFDKWLGYGECLLRSLNDTD